MVTEKKTKIKRKCDRMMDGISKERKSATIEIEELVKRKVK